MDERESELVELTQRLAAIDDIDDAWLAKSFTDQLVVVDVAEDAALPERARTLLTDHDCYGANEVYGTDSDSGSFAGAITNGTRHQFVDVRTRGDHQSYVLD